MFVFMSHNNCGAQEEGSYILNGIYYARTAEQKT